MVHKHRNILILIACGALVHGLTLGYAYRSGGAIDAFAFQSLDGREYLQIGVNLAQRGTFSSCDSTPWISDTWRTPGYPLWLAAVILVAGVSVKTLIFAQQVLGVLNVLLFYKVLELRCAPRWALAGALLFLLEPYHLYYSLWLLSTTWFLTVMLLTWHMWQKACASGRSKMFLIVGGLCGFLILIRPVGLLIPVALAGGLVFRWVRPRANRALGGTGLVTWLMPTMLVGASLLVTGTWLWRNYAVAGHWMLSDQQGVVLAYFKATEVELWRKGRSSDRYLETSLNESGLDRPHPTWERIDQRLRDRLSHWSKPLRDDLTWKHLAQGTTTQGDSFEVSRALSEIGAELLMEDPLATLLCCATRCASLLTFPLNLVVEPPTGVVLNRVKALGKAVPYIALLGWCLVSLVRNRHHLFWVFFPLVVTVALLLATTPQLDPRFRVPMVPLLLAIALMSCPSIEESTQ